MSHLVNPFLQNYPDNDFQGVELKYVDSKLQGKPAAINSPDSFMTGINILKVDQGFKATDRLGLRIHLQGIYIDGIFRVPPSLAQKNHNGYLSLVLDKQCNGVAPTPANIYEDKAPLQHPLRNMNYLQRFTILGHYPFLMGQYAAVFYNTVSGDPNQGVCLQHIHQYIDLRPLNIYPRYKDPTGSLANMTSDYIFLLFMSDVVDTLLNVVVRVTYFDA